MGINKEEFDTLIRAGAIPPNTSIMDMEAVHCGRCGWDGYKPQLRPVYDTDPNDPDEVITVAGCPACLYSDYLEMEP